MALIKLQRPEDVAVSLMRYLEDMPRTVCLWNDLGKQTSDFCLANVMEDITAEWLGRAIGADVISLETRLCGGGALGVAVLLESITYAPREAHRGLPKSFCVKMHSPDLSMQKTITIIAFSYFDPNRFSKLYP